MSAKPRGRKDSGARRMLGWGASAAAVFAVAAVLVLPGCHRGPQQPTPQTSKSETAAAHYVGSGACVACHRVESREWRTSQHHDAMAVADSHSVLGNFDDTRFTYAGVTSTFHKRDGQYYIRTTGPGGKLRDYRIKYTYGVYPLQQYLVEFPDGRIQAPSIAWDTRSAKQGGQRWFDLYPQYRITYKDELYWTRPSQNWNYMCADCHSTDLRKNYNAASNTFHTTWSEISVGCEACHGPGSRHVQWAESSRTGKPVGDYINLGLTVNLDERRGVTWKIEPATGNAVRSRPRETEREIQVCAQCHSRRGQIAENYEPGKPFLDFYRPVFLTSPNYYVDGQQHGEVYKWDSFLQSKMYAKGVTCTDCHNPHTGKLRVAGNAVCAQCHLPAKYDTVAHTHHPQDSAGGQCTSCHMPTTNYMVVDPRHDHSFRVPQPRLTVEYGVPNACNRCHTGRSAKWAAATVRKWYGHDPQGYQDFAAAFAAVEAGTPDAQPRIRAIAGNPAEPALVRATALAEMDPAAGGDTQSVLMQAIKDSHALVRLGALESLESAPLQMRAALAPPLLSDPLRTVRIRAAAVLAAVPEAGLGAQGRIAFASAAKEYVASLDYNADRAESRVALGNFYADQGRADDAVRAYRSAIHLNVLYVPAYANLADLYRATGRNAVAEQVLREGLQSVPDSANLHYALGLALVREKQTEAALDQFRRSVALAPDDAEFAYVYGVALYSAGQGDSAISVLKKVLVAHPDDSQVLQALAGIYNARGDNMAAMKYMRRLQALTKAGSDP